MCEPKRVERKKHKQRRYGQDKSIVLCIVFKPGQVAESKDALDRKT